MRIPNVIDGSKVKGIDAVYKDNYTDAVYKDNYTYVYRRRR
jgi:hypothetical protein